MHASASHPPAGRVDFLVRKEDGRIEILVEAKSRRRAARHWAIEWRDWYLRAYRSGGDPAMLLATPDLIFYWPAGLGIGAEPILIDARPQFEPFLSSVATGDRIDPAVFESAVGAWLEAVLSGDAHPATGTELDRLLAELRSRAHVVREASVR